MDVPFILQFVLICFDLQAMQVLMPALHSCENKHIYISLKKKSKQIEILYKNYHQVYSSFCGLQNTLTELFCHALILLVVYVTMSTLQ